LAKAGDWLERAEAENSLILEIAAFFASYSGQVKVEPYLLTAQDDEMIVAAALMTPPHRLLITRMPHPAVTLLVEHLLAEGASVPGVLGPRECARLVAENWVGRTGSSSRLKMRERIYACESVLLPILSRGDLRTATRDDEPLLIEWAGESAVKLRSRTKPSTPRFKFPRSLRRSVYMSGTTVSRFRWQT
jgi:uncharacterized protein